MAGTGCAARPGSAESASSARPTAARAKLSLSIRALLLIDQGIKSECYRLQASGCMQPVARSLLRPNCTPSDRAPTLRGQRESSRDNQQYDAGPAQRCRADAQEGWRRLG